MCKQIFLFLIVFFFENSAPYQFCSLSKSNGSCICKTITDETLNSAVLLADCARINLEDVPRQSQVLQRLSSLDLSYNNINHLEQTNDQFSSDTLEHLDLSFNKISRIDNDFFKNLPNLKKLVIKNNNLTSLAFQDIFQNLNNLLVLDLSFNNIRILSENIFLPLIRLEVFDLSYNDVALGDIILQSSEFLQKKLGLQENITHLRLNSLGLKEIPNDYFNNYQNMKHLSLADNYFENIPRVPYSVEYLDLSGTQISILQAKYLNYHSLKVLKLNRMKMLENINKYAFYNLQALQELSITSCNNLKEFNELIFGLVTKNSIPPLKRLSLARNSIKTLNYTYKYLFDKLDYLDLSDNPWNCDCNLLWMKELTNVYKEEFVQCASPFYLQEKSVHQINDEDLPKCHPEKYGKMTHRIVIPILILLIIVLSALIGYLIYYAPTWYGSRGIGPQSPYNPARTEED